MASLLTDGNTWNSWVLLASLMSTNECGARDLRVWSLMLWFWFVSFKPNFLLAPACVFYVCVCLFCSAVQFVKDQPTT